MEISTARIARTKITARVPVPKDSFCVATVLVWGVDIDAMVIVTVRTDPMKQTAGTLRLVLKRSLLAAMALVYQTAGYATVITTAQMARMKIELIAKTKRRPAEAP